MHHTTNTATPPTFLFLNGFGTYYFRIAIPRKLRNIINKYEIRRSLKTSSYTLAVKKARRLAVIAENLFQGDHVTEKELKELLLTSTQIKMTGPVKIGNGVLECGGIETDPDKHQEELETLNKIIELAKAATSSNGNQPISKLVERLLEKDPSAEEIVKVLENLGNGSIYSDNTTFLRAGANQQQPIKLSELITKYAKNRVEDGRWIQKTVNENLSIYDYLTRYFGDIPAQDITHDDADTFRNVLLQLPPNLNKSPLYRDKSISVVINMKPAEKLSTSSVNKYMRRISSMYNWAKKRENLSKNPFSEKQIQEDKQPNERRDMHRDADLAALFIPDTFYAELDKPHKFWIPLIALYTGARQNEIASLDAAAILDVEGLPCFKFITSKQKTYTERLTPIHSHLIRLGLIEYARKQTGKLFPELHKKRDGYGQDVSRWFNSYRRKCGLVERRNKDFHSFRHTLATSLSLKKIESRIISDIIGHSRNKPKSTTTETVYIKTTDLVTMAEAIEKLDYGEPINSLEPFDVLFPSAM